jgi:hypothetical protein
VPAAQRLELILTGSAASVRKPDAAGTANLSPPGRTVHFGPAIRNSETIWHHLS